jgi:DNA-binding NarL/FixJ family response regulator
MIRVAIADDHELIRDGFKKILSTETDIVFAGEAKSAKELLNFLTKNPVDVLVLDIGLPDRSGLEVLEELRVRNLSTKTLILSMHPERRYATQALKSGASGYITKDSASEILVKAIREIHNRGKFITEALADELSHTIGRVFQEAPHSNLSNREFQLLLLIGQGKTVKEIANNLSLSINTVNSYRKRLLTKMSFTSNAELIQYVMRYNLIP